MSLVTLKAKPDASFACNRAPSTRLYLRLPWEERALWLF